MCSHFESVTDGVKLKKHFAASTMFAEAKSDIWPGYSGVLVRSVVDGEAPCEAILGAFGLIPRWAKDTKITRSTYNARSETVTSKPSFRDAWKRGQHCIIPAEAIYEPDWNSGKAVSTRISMADDSPMGIAGLWECWQPQGAEPTYSFTMLTINADTHELMRNFHKPEDEKRMVVILPIERYGDWLAATPEQSSEFMREFSAQKLKAVSSPRPPRAAKKVPDSLF